MNRTLNKILGAALLLSLLFFLYRHPFALIWVGLLALGFFGAYHHFGANWGQLAAKVKKTVCTPPTTLPPSGTVALIWDDWQRFPIPGLFTLCGLLACVFDLFSWRAALGEAFFSAKCQFDVLFFAFFLKEFFRGLWEPRYGLNLAKTGPRSARIEWHLQTGTVSHCQHLQVTLLCVQTEAGAWPEEGLVLAQGKPLDLQSGSARFSFPRGAGGLANTVWQIEFSLTGAGLWPDYSQRYSFTPGQQKEEETPPQAWMDF